MSHYKQPMAIPRSAYPHNRHRGKHIKRGLAASALLLLLAPLVYFIMQPTPVDPDFEIKPLALPTLPAAQKLATDETHWLRVEIKSGDNLSTIFANQGLDVAAMHDILDNELADKNLTRLRPGQRLHLLLDQDNSLVRLEQEINEIDKLVVRPHSDGYQSEIVQRPVTMQQAFATGTIQDSLFVDGQRQGLDYNTLTQLEDIFAWDIDFALDIQPNDRFSVIYEERFREGEKISSGDIIAAEFVNEDHVFRAVRYEDSTGQVRYYTPDGMSLESAFIRTPVKFTRISSHFSLGRKHPVLHKIRAHKGVDYAAPRGTPVKATGNGRVSFVGVQNGYGKTVLLQHGQGYSTLYAHLNGFAAGLKTGSVVKQGDVIAYVGSTGLATGPHLHYEFRINGVHHNPITVQLPKDQPIPKSELANFKQYADLMMRDLMRQTELARATQTTSALNTYYE